MSRMKKRRKNAPFIKKDVMTSIPFFEKAPYPDIRINGYARKNTDE